jgi:UDP-N-acetylmuramate dehydrogenase
VNYGGGIYEDALSLINEAQQKIYETFGISLQCEVVILGDRIVTKK